MATFRFAFSARVPLGGDERRLDVSRDLTVNGTSSADVTLNIPENTPASPTTLWQSSGHALAAPTADFTVAIFAVDASLKAFAAGSTSLPLDLELSYTSTAGAVSTRVQRVLPEQAVMLTPNGGASGAAVTDILTRVRVTNPAAAGSPAGSNDREARLVLFK